MILKKSEELQKLMNILKPLIESDKPIQITLDKNTLISIHESALLSKMIMDRVTEESDKKYSTDKLIKKAKELMRELEETHLDFQSELENIFCSIFDKILEGHYHNGD